MASAKFKQDLLFFGVAFSTELWIEGINTLRYTFSHKVWHSVHIYLTENQD